jgi:hypothetical protein
MINKLISLLEKYNIIYKIFHDLESFYSSNERNFFYPYRALTTNNNFSSELSIEMDESNYKRIGYTEENMGNYLYIMLFENNDVDYLNNLNKVIVTKRIRPDMAEIIVKELL